MTLALGNLGLFGCKVTASLGESRMLVNELMNEKKPIESMTKSEVAKYLDAFEVCSALTGLDIEQMERYSSLLKCC
ncbi:MAG: hypothetical protein IJH76_01755 [Clostridia bacterium]|nr:hypothetical protein [Clostridia bacterium]